jgi:hypothetical protein
MIYYIYKNGNKRKVSRNEYSKRVKNMQITDEWQKKNPQNKSFKIYDLLKCQGFFSFSNINGFMYFYIIQENTLDEIKTEIRIFNTEDYLKKYYLDSISKKGIIGAIELKMFRVEWDKTTADYMNKMMKNIDGFFDAEIKKLSPVYQIGKYFSKRENDELIDLEKQTIMDVYNQLAVEVKNMFKITHGENEQLKEENKILKAKFEPFIRPKKHVALYERAADIIITKYHGDFTKHQKDSLMDAIMEINYDIKSNPPEKKLKTLLCGYSRWLKQHHSDMFKK